MQFAACLCQLRREAHAAPGLAETAIALATDYGLGYWLGQNMILYGWAIAIQGEHQAGLQQMCEGLATSGTTGSELLRPYYLSLLAEVYGHVAQPVEGLAVLEDALALVDKNDERWYTAELYRLKGELLLQRAANADTEAVACINQALHLARCQQAKSLGLRAAISLSRL